MEETHLHRVEPGLGVLLSLALECLHVDGVEVRCVGGNLGFGRAAEQFVHRLVSFLACDVPQRLIDRADCHDGSTLPTERQRRAVHLLPEEFALGRVFADDDLRERLLGDGGDGPGSQLPTPTPVMPASVSTSTTTSPMGPIHLRRAWGFSPSMFRYSSYFDMIVVSGNSTNSPHESLLILVALTSVISIIFLVGACAFGSDKILSTAPITPPPRENRTRAVGSFRRRARGGRPKPPTGLQPLSSETD